MDQDITIPQSASLTAPFTQRGLILGITGGTGCGKTTLLTAFEEMGGLVLDCDAIYHQLLATDVAMLQAIETRFPGTVENGVLQRKRLGAIVFADEAALLDLNRITHGAVKEKVLSLLQNHKGHAAIDAIALFEGGLAPLCDVTVAVTAPTEDRVQRLMARDSIPEDYARSRIAAQHNDSWFQNNCDHILENNSSFQEFYTKCLAFLQQLGIMEENCKGEINHDC